MPITHYIAETDGQGNVTAVWIKPNTRNSAKVFNPLADRFDPNEDASFDGASADQIKQWIIQQKLKAGC